MALADILKKVFGSKSDRDMKQVKPILDKILAAYPEIDALSNDELRAKMAEVERDLGRCDADTLYRETAKRFGYKTLSPKARARLEGVRI